MFAGRSTIWVVRWNRFFLWIAIKIIRLRASHFVDGSHSRENNINLSTQASWRWHQRYKNPACIAYSKPDGSLGCLLLKMKANLNNYDTQQTGCSFFLDKKLWSGRIFAWVYNAQQSSERRKKAGRHFAGIYLRSKERGAPTTAKKRNKNPLLCESGRYGVPTCWTGGFM